MQYFGKRYYAPLLGRWVSADPLTVHALGGDLNLYAYVSGMALKATDPLGLECTADQSCEATASTPEGGVQYGSGGDATVARHTQGATAAAKPGRSIPAPPPVSPSLPRAPRGILGAARDQVAGQMATSTNAVELGAGAIAWTFLAGVSAYEEIPRLILNFPSNAEIAGQHFARASHVEGGAEATLEVLEGVKSMASSAEGALMVAAPVAAAIDTPARLAASQQGRGQYPGVDAWESVQLLPGSRVAAGAPGASGFYSSAHTAESAATAEEYFQALQVGPHASKGYRPGATVYEVTKPTPAAVGPVQANPQHGGGGALQLFIPQSGRGNLRPMYTVILKSGG